METGVVVDDVVEDSGTTDADDSKVEALLIAAAVEEDELALGKFDVGVVVVDGDAEGMVVEDAGEEAAVVDDGKAEVVEVEAAAEDDETVEEEEAGGTVEAIGEDAAELDTGDGVGAG